MKTQCCITCYDTGDVVGYPFCPDCGKDTTNSFQEAIKLACDAVDKVEAKKKAKKEKKKL